MKVKDEVKYGTASTLNADKFLPLYAEKVHKFLKDNSSMGNDWKQDTASKLLILNKNEKGEVTNSNPYVGTFVATYIPRVPLITGTQLRDLCEHTNNKTPFGPVYIDFGIQANGEPEKNPHQTKALQEDYKIRGISNKEIWVPNFSQLRLIANKDTSLVFKLAEDVKQKDLTPTSVYNFYFIGKDGLFLASLLGGGGWYASGSSLSDSYNDGRIVQYDAEGVEIQKIPMIDNSKKTLEDKLIDEFLTKIN